MKRRGLWIPSEILALDLALAAKVIAAEVIGFQEAEKECFVSNQYLADLCGCSVATVKNHITDLIAEGIIEREKNDRGRRVLKLKSTGQNLAAPGQNLADPGQNLATPRPESSHYKNTYKNNYKNIYNGRDKTKRLLGELDEYSRRPRG